MTYVESMLRIRIGSLRNLSRSILDDLVGNRRRRPASGPNRRRVRLLQSISNIKILKMHNLSVKLQIFIDSNAE